MTSDSNLLTKILQCTKNGGRLLFRRNDEIPATEIVYRQNRGERTLEMRTLVLDDDLHLSRDVVGFMCLRIDDLRIAVEETK